MATMINGSRIDEQIYEFRFVDDAGKFWEVENYNDAKKLFGSALGRGKLKMRCIYKTEWMDAK